MFRKQVQVPLSPLCSSLGCGVNLSALKLKGVVFIRHILAKFPRSVNHWFRIVLLGLLLSFSWIHCLKREFIPESSANNLNSYPQRSIENATISPKLIILPLVLFHACLLKTLPSLTYICDPQLLEVLEESIQWELQKKKAFKVVFKLLGVAAKYEIREWVGFLCQEIL